jgi:copper transport protein
MGHEVPELALWSARLLVYLAHALLFGLVPVTLLVLRPAFASANLSDTDVGDTLVRRTKIIVLASLLAAVTGTLLTFLNNVLEDASLRDVGLGFGSVERVLASSFGQWQALRLPLLIAIGILLLGRTSTWLLGGTGTREGPAPRRWWAAWTVLSAALLLTIPFSGHAGGHDLRATAVANDFSHLGFGATWIAGIVALSYLLPGGWGRGSKEIPLSLLAPAVDRFSRVAFWSIAAVVVTGTINAVLHIGAFAPLFDSGYGRRLLLKVGAVILILGFGAMNHFFLRARLNESLRSGHASKHAPALRRNVRAELLLGVAVIAATSWLVGSPPPA